MDDPYFPPEFQTHSSDSNNTDMLLTSTGFHMASKRIPAHQKTHKITAAWTQKDNGEVCVFLFFFHQTSVYLENRRESQLKINPPQNLSLSSNPLTKCKGTIMGIHFSLLI